MGLDHSAHCILCLCIWYMCIGWDGIPWATFVISVAVYVHCSAELIKYCLSGCVMLMLRCMKCIIRNCDCACSGSNNINGSQSNLKLFQGLYTRVVECECVCVFIIRQAAVDCI